MKISMRDIQDSEITLNQNDLKKAKEGHTFIYELIDPISLKPNYIGYSKNPRVRYGEHLNKIQTREEKYTKKRKWIDALKEVGHLPLINILDEVEEKDWRFWESFWEDLYKSWGFELKNTVKCGYGPGKFKREPKTPEERKRHSEILKEGYRTGRLINPNKGRPISEKQKEKLRKNSSLFRLTKEDFKRRAEITKSKGHKRSKEQLERMYFGQLKKYISKPDYRCFVQMDMDGKDINKFLTPKIAALEVYGSTKKDVNICKCLSGHANYALGFKWRKGTVEETKELLNKKMLFLQ